MRAPSTRTDGEKESAHVIIIDEQRYSKEDKVATSNCCGPPKQLWMDIVIDDNIRH